MPVISRLFKVGSMTESLGVYLPAMIFQKMLGLARLLVLMYLLPKAQFGIWAIGAMIFDLGAPLITLGSDYGLVRYVSRYESRNQLLAFFRRARWRILAICAVTTSLAFVFSSPISHWAMSSRESALTGGEQLMICWAALANAALIALYLNMINFMYGMRVYRLISLVEISFNVTFLAAAAGAVLYRPGGLSVLVAHAVSVVLAMVLGMTLLQKGLRRLTDGRQAEDDHMVGLLPTGAPHEIMPSEVITTAAVGETEGFSKVLSFGLVALASTVLWNATGYASFRLAQFWYGQADAGVYQGFLRLVQPVVFLANAAWAVVFTHVAKQWESQQKLEAVASLQTAYKLVAMSVMTLTLVLYAAAPLWVRILPQEYRYGQKLLGGLVMYYQTVVHLALMTILAKLMERPIVITLAALVGGAVNVGLAFLLMPRMHLPGAAISAGLGMYIGGCGVTIVWLMIARCRLQASTYVILLLPAILLLPKAASAGLHAVLLVLALATTLIFSHSEKARIRSSAAGFAGSFRKLLART